MNPDHNHTPKSDLQTKDNKNYPASTHPETAQFIDAKVLSNAGDLPEEPSIEPNEFQAEIRKLNQNGCPAEPNGMFLTMPASEWIKVSKSTPNSKKLFDEFWHEGELCILFSDTNQGKSLLAVQMANSISKGVPIEGFEMSAVKQPVIYFDFEHSPKQFEKRYSVNDGEYCKEHYEWDPGFLRAEINPRKDIPRGMSFEEFLVNSIKEVIEERNARAVIIDNLTYLNDDLEKARNAAPLVKTLQTIVDELGCSILILAHTPKRSLNKPIQKNDLQGSKRIMDFCDSAFAIGESSNGQNIKYLKQIKVRSAEFKYTTENVVVCEINKDFNFLQIKFKGYETEQEHLREITKKEKSERVQKAISLHENGFSNCEIGRQLGISEATVRKWLKNNFLN